MKHRHITTTDWHFDAIDSLLERGDLADWRDLFSAAKSDRELARRIIHVAEKRAHGGASELARGLALAMWPDLPTD
jgi:hypothetical protein